MIRKGSRLAMMMIPLASLAAIACTGQPTIASQPGADGSFVITDYWDALDSEDNSDDRLEAAAWEACPNGWQKITAPAKHDEGPFGGIIWKVTCR